MRAGGGETEYTEVATPLAPGKAASLMDLSDIEAVVFDAVGTLIHPGPPAAVVYAEVGRRFGSRLTPAEVRPRFTAAFDRQEQLDLAAGLRTSEERELRRWRAIVAEVLADVTAPDACFKELYQHFARPEAWRCKPGTAAVLEALAGRGHVLALASNYDHRLRSVFAGLPELRHVRQVVISSEVGWRKPAPEFFAAVCRAVGLPAARVLHVGDDVRNDYNGATAAGLRAVLFDPDDRDRGPPPTIGSLAELLPPDRPPETGP
jgi:putative hydrolase of the HAD superfamily